MYVYPLKPDEIYHFGTKEHSGRYPWGSGERPRQRLEKPKMSAEEKAERSRARAEKAKKAVKGVGKLALKSALTGATIAAKVVFSSAITSATLAGVAAAGYAAITSPEMAQLMDNLAIKAGNFLVDRYVRRGIGYAANNTDEIVALGEQYLNEAMGIQVTPSQVNSLVNEDDLVRNIKRMI